MKKDVNVGDVFGAYTVINQEKEPTIRGGKRFNCKCSICGRNRIISESYLRALAKYNKCICGQEKKYSDIRRDYNYIQRNYGNINLCGYCTDIFKCSKYKQNAIDKRYMYKYRIDKVTYGHRKRNLIIVLDCGRFKFDWGKNNV